MDSARADLPDDVDQLKQLVLEQQALLKDHAQSLSRKQTLIECLEEKLRLLYHHRFGQRSEHSDQLPLQLFNEAEILAQESESVDQTLHVNAHPRQRRRAVSLPEDLPRVEVVHDLDEAEKRCDCGQSLALIGQDVSEQLAVIPQQYYVIRHLRLKYACACKQCIRSAATAAHPLPGSQASAQLLAHTMVSKYVDGLPLYRLEQMAKREGLELPRAKLARWLIRCSQLLQPLYNLLQETFFGYDIVQSDETGIQVLKEQGRRPDQKSFLWIRRGGPPDRPVVLVDYCPSKSGHTAYSLLSECTGYLVCDAATNFNQSIQRNALTPVLCNDHARRKFAEVIKSLPKKAKTRHWAARKAIVYYKQLYLIEREIKDLPPRQKYAQRQAQAVPIWDAFIAWAQIIYDQGVAHRRTREALGYLLGHAQGLRRYCEDGRLPISNIQTEHVAKTIAIARKNFLFADTPAGAKASALIYSLLESAKANGHNLFHYMAVILTELPRADSVEDFEALLPWALSAEQASQRYHDLPKP